MRVLLTYILARSENDLPATDLEILNGNDSTSFSLIFSEVSTLVTIRNSPDSI